MRTVWLLGIASLILFIGLAVYLMPLQPNIVVLQFAFNAESFQAVLVAWQPEGVTLFRSHLPVDTLFLACYGLFGYLYGMRSTAFRGYAAGVNLACSLLLPIAACADAVENGLHWIFTGGAGEAWMWLVPLAATCSSIKFLAIALFFALVWRAHHKSR